MTINQGDITRAETGSASRDERLAHIVQSVQLGRFVALREIAERFNVNMQTARRDVALLDARQLVARVHGGAIARDGLEAMSMEERLGVHDAEKQRIAQAAAGFIDEGDVIFLDGGSTTAFLAPYLLQRSLHVVTNAMSLATRLKAAWPNVEVILTGGYYFPKSELLLGPPALQTIAGMQVNKAFFSAAGVTAEGIFNANMLVAELEQAVIAQAGATYLLVDSSKLDHPSLMRVCAWEAIHTLITDGPVPEAIACAAQAAACRIVSC
jgi:DeoR/GlpR family transcriptional regulator of sugar metabolism